MRQTKHNKEPWEEVPEVWATPSAYFTWLRGQLRRAWARHPVKVAYMQANRFKAPIGKKTKRNPKGEVWATECEHCHGTFRQTDTEVDHMEQAGSFKSWEDFLGWVHRLMHINFDSIRIVCQPCHRIISYAQRMGISFEEAALEKEVIAFTKLSVSKQKALITLIMPHCTEDEMSNASKRREVYGRILAERQANGAS
jgi:hypothetical protein